MAAAILYLVLDNYVLEQGPPETVDELSQDAIVPEGKIMLAVLPLKNLTGNPEQEDFCDGLTGELIAQLGSLQRDRLGVIARTSAMYYKGKNKRVDEIGRELGVDYLLEGSVSRDGNRVRVTAQLIQVSDQSQLWADSFERDLDDVFALQGEVAQRVTRTLKLELLPEEQARLRSTRPANFQAYEAFLKGRREEYRWDEDKLRRAIEHYEEAIRQDPTYALAYTALAHAWGTLGWAEFMPVEESNRKLWDYTRKAAELDPDLAEVHVLFAELNFYHYWDWAGAEAGFRRAFELDPGSHMAVWHYAICLTLLGRHAEAIEVAERGLQLNPHSRWINDILGNTYRNWHQYERAIEQFRRLIELAPRDLPYQNLLGYLYQDLGRDDEAVDVYLRARTLAGDGAERVKALWAAYQANGINGYWQKRLEHLTETALREDVPPNVLAPVYARLGDKEQALAWLDTLKEAAEHEHVSPLIFAETYTRLGEKDQALMWLENAFEQHTLRLVNLKVANGWDPLRDEPRFQDLLRRMNFPD